MIPEATIPESMGESHRITLEHLHMMLHDMKREIECTRSTLHGYRLDLIELKYNAILQLLICIHTGKAVDLNIVFGLAPLSSLKGSDSMSNKKAAGPAIKVACLRKKGSAPAGAAKSVMPDVTLTDPLPRSMTLQPLDAAGNAVVLTSADQVAGTLVSDSEHLTVTAGVDSLNYVGTIPANTPQGSAANLAATLKGTIQGAPADLTASVKVIINVPPVPVAVDLAIIFA